MQFDLAINRRYLPNAGFSAHVLSYVKQPDSPERVHFGQRRKQAEGPIALLKTCEPNQT
jgi:hypothetical protein